MKKFILIVDPANPSLKVLDFAAKMSSANSAELKILMLENVVADQRLVVKSVAGMPYVDWDVDVTSSEYREKLEKTDITQSVYRNRLSEHKIKSVIERQGDDPLAIVLNESRYCDLIIMEPQLSFRERDKTVPSRFAKKVLEESECPVLITPTADSDVNEIVLAFDDSESSVFAIKQFSYILSAYTDKPLHVLHIADSDEWNSKEKKELEEWLRMNFSNVRFELMSGVTEEKLFAYLVHHNDRLLVIGAYGRSHISNVLRHSRAELVLKGCSTPVFITHK